MVNVPNAAHSSTVRHSHLTTSRKRNQTDSKALASTNIWLTKARLNIPVIWGNTSHDEKYLPLELMANLCQMFNGSKDS